MEDRHAYFMKKALGMAFSRMGTTSPNPAVGAVIVKNGEIISLGGTCACGSDHAEVDAIKNAAAPLDGAELYVTLEPCCHYGKTPPCTRAIIEAGILRVYIPILDPNPSVAGEGAACLRDAGVDVVMMTEMEHYASSLIRPFKKSILERAPFVIHKTALSLDGRIATSSGDSKWISSAHARYFVHRLRAVVDAIVVGKNTLAADNPSLTVRLDSFSGDVKRYFAERDFDLRGHDNFFVHCLLKADEPACTVSPCRIVLGIPDDLEKKYAIFADGNYIMFADESKKDACRTHPSYDRIKKLESSGNIVFVKGATVRERVDATLGELNRRGMMCVLLEGGGVAAGTFLDAGQIDHFLYVISPRIIGRGVPPIMAAGAATVRESLALHDVSTVMINDDLLYSAYREPYGAAQGKG